ncbi:HpcH/HpaI aldolase family protein [Rhodococcus erythropolis]|uniref:HpcH/HpaI aldolase family protein n=1 Tax=Rhodococcus erythropolis TaxID=1833 RepID=UPI000878B666|nr:aldolase/citrate lyase family protein [Rhodococcus erythropolis]OFV73836.1 5-keto-4-deoxy-D-glucarate aldolase [Rhodococcus erythropolis]
MTVDRIELRAGLRARLVGSEPALGTMVKIDDFSVLDIARRAGLDFVVIDGEHSQLGDSGISRMLRYALALGLPALLRIASLEPGIINRALESGAAGIQLSNVNSRRQVVELIDATRYAPGGTRSIGLAHPGAGHGTIPIADYLEEEAAQPPLVVVQIESPHLLDPLADIIVGVDVAFHGPTDMSVALGLHGSTDHADYREERRRLDAAAMRASVPIGSWIADPGELGECIARGERYVAIGSDLQILGKGLRALTVEAPGRSTPELVEPARK